MKYWPSGGWAFTQTGALTRADTVPPCNIFKKNNLMYLAIVYGTVYMEIINLTMDNVLVL